MIESPMTRRKAPRGTPIAEPDAHGGHWATDTILRAGGVCQLFRSSISSRSIPSSVSILASSLAVT